MTRIKSVSCVPVSEPLLEKWSAAHGTSSKRDECLVLVTTEDGGTGIGEAYHAFSPTVISALVDGHLAEILVGRDANSIQALWEEMFFSTGQLGSAAVAAISGVDIALWDLMGRSTGLPVATLLGGGGIREIAAYVGCMCLGFQEAASLREEVRGYVAGGFTALKVRGGRSLEADVEAVAVTREAAGPGIDIMIDANSAYSPPESLQLARRLERYDTFWLEDPFDFSVKYHHADMGWLRGRSPVPIASGGNLYTRFDVRALIDAGGVDYLTPDVTKCGGISEGMRIAALASAHNITVAPHTVVGVGTVAGVHYAAAVPAHVRGHLEWDASPVNPLRDELCAPALAVDRGAVRVPTGPGLGIALPTPETYARFRFIGGREISMPPRLRRWDPSLRAS
ncbi:MAG: mandelate racemase/muconate lactonizing enzyme family protein [Alphaproteobacteria bacterium]|nr:mandelate racemase/muconate lactonizing enzyme family protein [Alphaproteobacteria bacterium]